MTDVTYSHAAQLRDEAERTGSAELFRQAAAEFKKLNMLYAAAACDKKAEHYEAKEDSKTLCAWFDKISTPDFDGCAGCQYNCALGVYPPSVAKNSYEKIGGEA